jgi:hypothetical protein
MLKIFKDELMRNQTFPKFLIKLAIFVFFLFFSFSVAHAQQDLYQGHNFSIGISGWFSSGQTDWNHDATASSSLLGNPSSELTYEDVDSNVIELNAEFNMPNRFFVRGDVGFGSFSDGRLIDDDFLTTSSTGDFLASRTFSDIDDDGLWYFDLDFGYTIWTDSYQGKSMLRAFVGYQRWEEEYVAKGITYDTCTVGGSLLGICLPAGSTLALGEKVISNKVEWDSIKLGLEGKFTFWEKLGIEASAVFIPYSDMHNEDIHHLRTDLLQPGFVMDGTGIGYNFEIAATYEVLPNLFLSAGYQFWKIESDGDIEVRGISGTSVFPLNDLDSERDGATVGLSFRY